jgi:exo-beta-1,3-glucanase (GH17 family)
MILMVLYGSTIATGHELRSAKWQQRMSGLLWVAYSPPNSDPNRGIEATPAAITEDLAVLRKVGFTGLVTYGSSGVLGRELPSIAKRQGFKGVIMGVWDPTSQEELAAAKNAAHNPIVVGFCVGNEGLGSRYEFSVLSIAIHNLRKETGKPVTTTEIVERYSNDDLLRLGDWVFPNAHPYFHGKLEAEAAVRWTRDAYDNIKNRARRYVIFKEVGLPTAGDPHGRLSEAVQERYYRELAKTKVRFIYFEAFDQPWKTHLPVEPHWGLFRSDRTPKLAGLSQRQRTTPKRSVASIPPGSIAPQTRTKTAFFIYKDANSPDNHYQPTGYMGDVGDIKLDEAFAENPHSGNSSIRVEYEAKGKGPNECVYNPPCKWAGVYWQEPPRNWGKEERLKNNGFNLSPYGRLKFWARTDKPATIEFKVGGIDQPYGDSLMSPRSQTFRLNKDWQEFEISLRGANLTHIIGGFCWVTNWDANPAGLTFYLDDIRFEP